MQAAPIGTKDQKIHSGQFKTNVLFPLASWVSTLSMPYLNRTTVKATLNAVLTTSRILLAFAERRSGSKERLTSSPSRAASAAARSVIRTNTATTSSSVNDQDWCSTLRERTFPTVSTTIRIVDSTRTSFSTNASPFMIFLYTFICFLPFPAVRYNVPAGSILCQAVLPGWICSWQTKKSAPQRGTELFFSRNHPCLFFETSTNTTHKHTRFL